MYRVNMVPQGFSHVSLSGGCELAPLRPQEKTLSHYAHFTHSKPTSRKCIWLEPGCNSWAVFNSSPNFVWGCSVCLLTVLWVHRPTRWWRAPPRLLHRHLLLQRSLRRPLCPRREERKGQILLFWRQVRDRPSNSPLPITYWWFTALCYFWHLHKQELLRHDHDSYFRWVRV